MVTGSAYLDAIAPQLCIALQRDVNEKKKYRKKKTRFLPKESAV